MWVGQGGCGWPLGRHGRQRWPLLSPCPRLMIAKQRQTRRTAAPLCRCWVQLTGAPAPALAQVTHLVIGDERRTLKLMLAVANGAWLVSPQWVTASLEAGRWLPESQFPAKVSTGCRWMVVAVWLDQAQRAGQLWARAALGAIEEHCGSFRCAPSGAMPLLPGGATLGRPACCAAAGAV